MSKTMINVSDLKRIILSIFKIYYLEGNLKIYRISSFVIFIVRQNIDFKELKKIEYKLTKHINCRRNLKNILLLYTSCV